jgi:hypothetical protein
MSMDDPAETARSILARPGAVILEVDEGVHVDVGRATMTDAGGIPRLTTPIGTGLGSYAERGARAVLRVDTPAADGADRTLTVSGVLVHDGVEECECCSETRHVVSLAPDFVLLTTWARVGERRFVVGRPERVDLAAYRAPELSLNAGYLRSAADHATEHHQDELRSVVAGRTGTPRGDVIAVQLARLTPRSVQLVWVDREGGHRTTLVFPRKVRTPHQLAAALRLRLGVGAC